MATRLRAVAPPDMVPRAPEPAGAGGAASRAAEIKAIVEATFGSTPDGYLGLLAGWVTSL
jgi:hypothetical protein